MISMGDCVEFQQEAGKSDINKEIETQNTWQRS